MLTRHIQKSVEVLDGGKQYKYTCYGDHEDKNKFYVIPETPEYALDKDSKPKFQFYQYRGDASNPEEGGFGVFTVRLPFPNTAQKEKIKVQLQEGLAAQLEARAKKTLVLVKAYRNKQEADWQSLKNQLGYTDEQVRAFSAQYEESKGWEQYLQTPDLSVIKLEPVAYTDAEVSLLIESAPDKFFEKKLNPTSPSKLGDNETVFVLSLSDKGAAFFEQALKKGAGSSIAAVKYKLSFECVLPAATVNVFYNAEEVRNFSRQIDRNIWGQATEEKVKDEYQQKNAAGVKVFLGSTEGLTDKEAKDLEKELREWGQTQLDDILSNQTGGLDMSNIGQRFKTNPDKISEELKNTKDINRTFTESRIVTYTVYPQMQLPSIEALVGEANLKDYFHEVDLKDDFFKKKAVKIQANADFEKLGIHSIEVKLDYENEPQGELVFNRNNPSEVQDVVWYLKFVDKTPIHKYKYSYQVNYFGADKSFQSEIKETDEDVLTINVGDLGIIHADISTGGINWSLVERAQVKLKYEDPSVNVIEAERILTEKSIKADSFIKPIFVPRTKALQYRTKFFMKDGKEFWFAPGDIDDIPATWASEFGSDIHIDDPFKETLEYTILAVGLDSKTDAIVVELSYSEPGIDYNPGKTITLDSSNRSAKWAVPTISKDKAKVNYSGFIQFKNGTTRQFSGEQSAKIATIKVGNVREDILTVEVDAEEVDFKQRFSSAKVTLLYEDTENHVKETKFMNFKDEDSDSWSVDLKDKNHKEYKWQAVFVHKNSLFGDKGKIYLPGTSKDSWNEGETRTQLSLKDEIPSDATLAEQSKLLMLKVSKKGIDWSEIETLKVIIEYGKTKQTFRIDQGEGNDDPDLVFLAPIGDSDGSGTYSWRLETKTDDGDKEYYPGPDQKAMQKSDEREIFLNDYISVKHGGERNS
jgi:hypothetical protein